MLVILENQWFNCKIIWKRFSCYQAKFGFVTVTFSPSVIINQPVHSRGTKRNKLGNPLAVNRNVSDNFRICILDYHAKTEEFWFQWTCRTESVCEDAVKIWFVYLKLVFNQLDARDVFTFNWFSIGIIYLLNKKIRNVPDRCKLSCFR